MVIFMGRVVLLDSSPLSMVTNPAGAPVNQRCRNWMEKLLGNGFSVKVPEVIDYELRRELIRGQKADGVARLDKLAAEIGGLLPLDGAVFRKSAELWAEARSRGKAMADDLRLDIDVILCAHAVLLIEEGFDVEVATSNTKHLSVFTKARQWFVIKTG